MQMKFRMILPLLLLGAALLGGCTETPAEETTLPDSSAATEDPWLAAGWTVPADGNGDDVTCKGTYTAEENADAVVATAGDAQLTNGQLRAWYWLEVASYRQGAHEIAPDFSQPLETQACPLDETVRSWQQYFLERALNSWHSAQALALQGRDEGVPTEAAYNPNESIHERCLTGKPATRFLYGYSQSYQPNTMHQEYLDNMEQVLEELALSKGYPDSRTMARDAAGCELEDLTEAARLYNLGYMYLTTLSYEISCTQEEVQAALTEETAGDTGCVNFRHILLIPEGDDVSIAQDGTVTCSEAAWEACMQEAKALLRTWEKDGYRTEKAFGILANQYSEDPGSAPVGGAYYQVSPGQMTGALDNWLFYTTRQVGDAAVIRSDYGCHVLYLTGSCDTARIQAEAELTAQKQTALITAAKEKYPMTVEYSAIALTQADGALSRSDVLYPDVAHERFPEVPLYLQQDYPGTMYGGFPVATHGCGITSMAMLASYLTDDELTVPEMCAMFGRYCLETGTNYLLFENEPATLGFYLKEFTKSAAEAKAALEEGYVVVSLQHRGYWTRGGHFIVIEEILENDQVRVRDSNLYNFGTLSAHQEDLHGWDTVTPRSAGYWIYNYKVTNIPACNRCGGEGAVEGLMEADYFCQKCIQALLRRNTYLNRCNE